VDLKPPTFSHPTDITNPLFPIAQMESTVLLGQVDGKPFRSETTLLPRHGHVVLDGKPVEVLLSQYTAYLNGQITETALDRYAQADDGSVWYLGEDVFDYDPETGAVHVTEGTWLAGRDGPPAMIMPAHPKVGDAFRTENVPGVVFEEVTVKAVDQTVDGPLGKVKGAMIGTELHLDGAKSDKTFAPGYGEFFTKDGADIEALATSVKADRAGGREPVALANLVTGTWGVTESARLEDWEAVDSTLDRIKDKWAELKKSPQPVRVRQALDGAMGRLSAAVAKKDVGATTKATVDVAQSAVDLTLRYRPVPFVDVERFHLHAQRLRVAAAADDAPGVNLEVATLEWLRERLTGTLSGPELARVDDQLALLRSVAASGDLPQTGDVAARLAATARILSGP
jgi:hypothetical protein